MDNTLTKIATVTPATDILEMADGFHIIMDMPGVAQKDLSVNLEENELAIRGHSSYMCDLNKNDGRVHSEFDVVSYERIFTISDMVDRENVTANLKDGVLRLFLPKAEALKPRRINIAQG